MIELAFIFWGAMLINLLIIVFGSLHYRIDPRTDVVYTSMLFTGVLVMVVSGVVWVITQGS